MEISSFSSFKFSPLFRSLPGLSRLESFFSFFSLLAKFSKLDFLESNRTKFEGNSIWKSLPRSPIPNFAAFSLFRESSIKDRTFTCPVCWALFGSPLSFPQLHFTVWPLMSVLWTATIACVADSLVENLKYNHESRIRISLFFPPFGHR